MYRFALEGKELETVLEFKTEHNKTCKYHDDGTKPSSPTGAIGGQYTYAFTPTSLGSVIIVSCACGAEKNCTDFDMW